MKLCVCPLCAILDGSGGDNEQPTQHQYLQGSSERQTHIRHVLVVPLDESSVRVQFASERTHVYARAHAGMVTLQLVSVCA